MTVILAGHGSRSKFTKDLLEILLLAGIAAEWVLFGDQDHQQQVSTISVSPT